MPGTMTDSEQLLSLLSIEVLVSQVQLDLKLECHLPCVVFRLLDYPAVSIPYFDTWQVQEFHQLKRNHPKSTWRQLLSDQFYELRSANGKFNFSRGKSCLFKTYFKTLYTHLLNVPLFVLLIDQINDQGTTDHTTHFIGSCNVKLNELIELLNQAIIRNGNDIPLVEQQTFHCTLFNLMGTPIGTCDLAVRFCQYGSTILTQLPMLDETVMSKPEKQAPVAAKVSAIEPPVPVPPTTDTIVKHIHFVNEKRDVGLQLSRSDLPSTSNNSKSAQTRWTSTKTPRSDYHHSKSRYLRTIDDPSLDDPSTASYRPPPLYFNSHSDFLQMMTPATTNDAEEAKENRLSYLASIPIEHFTDDVGTDHSSDEDENHLRHQRKVKSAHHVRFNLPSTSMQGPANVPRSKAMPTQPLLATDFLQNFPLLRSLVEEALALQNQGDGRSIPLTNMIFGDRPSSAAQQGQRKSQPSPPPRPQSATQGRSIRTKSVIISRKPTTNPRRLYPPPPQTRQMVVTKNEVRSLVDRLSKPKFNKRIEREIAVAVQMIALPEPPITPRPSTKPTSAPVGVTAHKPPLSYGTTRAHRLYAEYARARRAAQEPQAATSPKSQRSPRKESPSNGRIPPLSPQLINTGTLSHFSLLNKVDMDTATMEKNGVPQTSSERRDENTSTNIKTSSTTSQDVTLELNRRSSSASSSSPSSSPTPSPTMPDHVRMDNQNNELGFSITDVTDYFTDGGNGSSTRPSTRQSP